MNQIDTIAASATGLGNSSIGIVRISGSEAVKIADKVYRSKKVKKRLGSQKTHTIHYGYVYDRDILVDEVMVVIMRGPNSYTTEDTVEINCHGGAFVTNKILETVIKHGARPAEPGEFTKRAFLNGRIDLSKAEAVMDIIQSQNDFALESSVEQLRGAISRKITQMREKIIYHIAFIEAALDDPEHISLEGYREQLKEEILSMEGELSYLVDSFSNGRVMTEGIKTVILGKPNVGKSSLMNVLLGEERAIVTNIAGTTRDTLEEKLSMGGITLHVVDTAGIRDTKDVVEKIGVERARQFAGKADLILYVVDTSVNLDENDKEIASFIASNHKSVIVLLNKSDLDNVVSEEDVSNLFLNFINSSMAEKEENGKGSIIMLKSSARNHSGLEELEKTVRDIFFQGEIKSSNEIVITNMRHKEALQEAFDSLMLVKKSIEEGMPEDFYSIDLMSAYSSLGRIIGEEVDDDLVEEIFSKFCLGK